MMKFTMMIATAITLSACVDGGGDASVSRMDTLSSSCASQHMRTTNGLPMRCGPQTASPYTMR